MDFEKPQDYKNHSGMRKSEETASLPKGVYLQKNKSGNRFRHLVWSKQRDGDINWIPNGDEPRVFDTPEECAYRRKMAMDGHHWEGMPEDRAPYFGFVYEMVHRETGKIYIGSKQFIFWNGPRGGYKCTAPADKDFFDPTLWVPSDWPTYMSSSRKVQAMAEEKPWVFQYKVLHLCYNKLELHLAEIEEHVERDVLQALGQDGDFLYLNENIMGVEYRPPVPRHKLYAAKKEAEVKLRDYYLRPEVCSKCGTMLEYGQVRCSCHVPMSKTMRHEQLIGS